MITRGNGKYAGLFAVASEYLGLPEVITSLDQYFSHITELAGAASDHPEFMKLPIDEPCFEINLDSREISVPADFLGGISVEGDQIAENIWFKVDRFFDQKDLLPDSSNNKNYHIIVQWTNAAGTEGLSETLWYNYKLDDNDALIFCWPITESITAKAGSVKFSVRFYETKADDEKTIVYNLNTKPCYVTILEALDSSKDVNNRKSYTLDHEAETYIISQLKNTALVGEYSPVTPVFLEPTVPSEDGGMSDGIKVSDTEEASYTYVKDGGYYRIDSLTTHDSAIEFYVVLDTEVIQDEDDFQYLKTTLPEDARQIYTYSEANGFIAQDECPSPAADGSLPLFYVKKTSPDYVDLYIEAMSAEGGEISYFWDNSNAVRNEAQEADVYYKTNDTAPVEGALYYEKTDAGYKVWNSAGSTVFPEGKELYERYNQFKAGIADTYYGGAKSRVGASTKSTSHARAKKFVVVGPKAPVLSVEDKARQVVITYHLDPELNEDDASAINDEKPGRKKAKEYLDIAKANKKISDEIWYFDSTTGAWKELTKIDDWALGKNYCRKYAQLAIDATGSAEDTLSYQWAINKAVEGYGDKRRHVPVEGGTEASLIVIDPNSLEDTDERYVVDVTSTRNNAEIVATSEPYRVTDLPVAPALQGDYYVLDKSGRPCWKREELGGKVVTKEFEISQPDNEDFAYHGASSYLNVNAITSDVMKFKVTPSIGANKLADDFYYEWHMAKSASDDQIIKQGLGSDYAVCYFPKEATTENPLASKDIVGSNIYCVVWTALNGLSRPDKEDYDLPAFLADETKLPANIYGNMTTSAKFVIYNS